MSDSNELDPKREIYPPQSRALRIVEGSPTVGLVGLLATAWAVWNGFSTCDWTWLFVAIGAWAIIPPLWFACEYFYIYRRHGLPGTFELFQHGQQVSAAIWAGILTLLIALAASDLVERKKNERREGEANQALQTTPLARSVCEKTIEFGRSQRGV